MILVIEDKLKSEIKNIQYYRINSASSAVILRGKTSKQSSLILFVFQSAGSLASTCSRYSSKQCRIKTTIEATARKLPQV